MLGAEFVPLYLGLMIQLALLMGCSPVSDTHLDVYKRQVRAIKKIPKKLKNAPEFLEVRGEVYMPHEAFQHLCAEQELQGAAPFKLSLIHI